jgi:hypothetical protein
VPDLSNCIKDGNGNIWCWDAEGEAVLLIDIKKPPIGKVPPEVLLEISMGPSLGQFVLPLLHILRMSCP